MAASAPIYSDVRRRLAVLSVVVAVIGLWQTLRVSARAVTTLVIQVPATTHLLTTARTIALPAGPLPSTPAPSAAPITTPPPVATSPPPTRPPVRINVSPPVYVAAGARPAEPAAAAPSAPTPPPTEVARAPMPGVYDYRYTVGNDSANGTITVAAPSGDEETETESVAGTTRQRTLAWGGDAVTIVASDYGGGHCQWSPPLVAWEQPLAVGERWATDSTCTLGSGSVREQESASVQGVLREAVDGRQVQAWVIERHTVMTEDSGNIVMTIESQSSEMFDAADGLVLFEEGRTVTPNADGSTTTTDSSMELTS